MAKNNRKKERQIGKKNPVLKEKAESRIKNTIWTIVILVLLLIAFIVNNTRDVPESGPYPPLYDKEKSQNIYDQ